MSRVVQAVKHYGCPKKRYKFEMHIHRVVLTSEKRKLFTRILWTRGKKHADNQRYRTKWCEGVENYNIDESVFHEATIYFTSNTNQIQSKITKITLQIRERIDSKDLKFAKFQLDLAKYVDISSPHRVFYQRLNYEKARKKAQLIFSIKSIEMNSETVSDCTDNEDDDEDTQSQSNYTDCDDNESMLSITSINTIQNAMSGKITEKPSHPSASLHSKNPKTSTNTIHSNISGKTLKLRNYRKQSISNSNTNTNRERSPTPPSTSNMSITITRRDTYASEQFIRDPSNHHITPSSSHERITPDIRPHSPTVQSSSSDVDIAELRRKLKLYEDKHKKYKWKYARLCKKVEEQEIEQQCQNDEICRLKRVEEDIKTQSHTMRKYRKKIKSLGKERESLKKTLQKRNQTIINLNKANSKLKQQILSLQTLESVRYNSDVDDNMTEYNDHEDMAYAVDKTYSKHPLHHAPQGVYILTARKMENNAQNGEDYDKSEETPETKDTNDETSKDKHILRDELEESINTPLTVSTVTPKEDIIALPAHMDTRKEQTPMGHEMIDRKSASMQYKETIDDIGEKQQQIEDILSPEILKLVQNKQMLLQNQTKGACTDGWSDTKTKKESILSEIQSQWMHAETEKLNYKKLYEQEKVRVSHYKSKTNTVSKRYEKTEVELSIARHELHELQQKYGVMEEVYVKLKQDLTRMMDSYSRLELDHERMEDKLRQCGQCLSDDND